ncbi:MAG: NADH:ubiquinone subunit [Lasallia pustulata]|uniref:NADH:ubiquinone subunit n=1 Tax=Lasallia pustulata TaxID=136370 RepID=A0A5M8PXL3_9LECA|nr:MAG: NADH:ubiquinone subunit [Lasallia pustulata]
MSSSPASPLKRLWFRWKSLKLPWRRRWLAGSDLLGNTFWEFKDSLNANRFRRIVNYNPRAHYSDIHITPQWHQWLRHTRATPPSLTEQRLDLTRQQQLKQLARLADERWAAKPSFLDDPRKMAQAGPATLPRDSGGYEGGRAGEG